MEQLDGAWDIPVPGPPGPLGGSGGGGAGGEDIEQQISRAQIEKPNDLLHQLLNVTQSEYDEGQHVSIQKVVGKCL